MSPREDGFDTIAEVVERMERWEARCSPARYDAEGKETFTSRLRRAADAWRLQREYEKEHPEARTARLEQLKAIEAEERKQRNAEHEARFQVETPAALRRMGLREQEIAILGDLKPTGAVQAVEAWRTGSDRFLVLGGRTGGGKTIAAASLLMHAKARWKSESFDGWFWETGRARFVKATELARLSYYGEETRDKLDSLVIVPLLVIDDLGAEQTSDGWRSTLLDLIDASVREGNRTCITTNLSEKAEAGARRFSQHVGERVFRRLKDFGQFVAVDGPRRLSEVSP